jgi:hypothetical protein
MENWATIVTSFLENIRLEEMVCTMAGSLFHCSLLHDAEMASIADMMLSTMDGDTN